MATKTEVQTFQLQEKSRTKLVDLLAKIEVGNEVLRAAQGAVQKYADRFNTLSEAAVEQFGLDPKDPRLEVDWNTGAVKLTVEREVPDEVVEPVSDQPTE